jgi:hypothetical protein
MGFVFSADGECVVCKRVVGKHCDACRRYVCDAHQVEVPVPGSSVVHIFCPECYSKGKKPVNFTQHGRHAHYG